MSAPLPRLLDAIDVDRAASTAFELVKVDSPSGHEHDVAMLYASMLDEVGLDVVIDDEYPESPSIIARTPGFDRERALHLCGHLDTVPNPHPPPRLADGVLSGRGAADMKSGMAAIVEVLRALRTSGSLQRASLLVTAYGQHEEPVGDNPLHAPLLGLLGRGIHGTACLIPEGPHDSLPVAGRGLVIFEVAFVGPEQATHEVLGSWPSERNPVLATFAFGEQLRERSRGWTLVDDHAGPESYFLGYVNGGDLYNRVPVRVTCGGTRRYPMGRTYEEVRGELAAAAREAAESAGVDHEIRIVKSGQPFRLREDDDAVRALRRAHRTVTGDALQFGGMQYSADASQVMEHVGITAVYHGVNSTTAHADHEFVTLGDLERCAKVIAATAAGYLWGEP